jgi:mono/diheme cytochrome c family protein
MKLSRVPTLLVLIPILFAGAPAPISAQSTGAYTAAQAQDGAALYTAQCVQCHGVKLEGVNGPSLAGSEFIARWNGKTAGDLYDFISALMPESAPGSLKPSEYIVVLAFLLQQNHYPAGAAPLTAARAKSVKIAKQGG